MRKHAKKISWFPHDVGPFGIWRAVIYIAVFALILPYYEVVFNLSTSKELFRSWGAPMMLLFSVSYGLIAYVIVSFIKNRKANHIVTTVLIALLTVPYLVQYFVYSGFKNLYSITTMVSGAADMAGGYSKEAMDVVVSWDGALKILLFALPAVLYGVFGRYLYADKVLKVPTTGLMRCLSLVLAVLCYCSSLLLINAADNNVVRSNYYNTGDSAQYDYKTAVENFGLLTGMGLDLQYLSAGGKEMGMEQESTLPVMKPGKPSQSTDGSDSTTSSSQPTGDSDTTAKPVEYGYNQMDLNLSGGSGEIKTLNEYVTSRVASKKNAYTGLFKDKNLIMITAEAFTAEVIDPVLTPTLYRLANKGVRFTDYYQPASAGTTGGEYQHIFGMMPTSGGKSFKETADHYNYMTMGSQLDRLGYYGKAFHNNSYTYYDRDKTHNNLGYSDGFMGYGNGMEEYVQKKWPQSDFEMIQGTLPTYIDKEKFNVYYMSVSGHNGYSTSGNSMTARNWDLVKDLPYSDEVKGYLAANLELEKALTYLVEELEKKGIADDTVISITSDHFPYGLSDEGLAELYGGAPENTLRRDHSAWILWCGSLEKEEPIVVEAPTFSLDILPTLSNLFGTEFDSRLFPGRDVFSDAEAIVFNTGYDWKTEYGTYYASKGQFVAAEGVEVPEGYVDRMKVIVRNKMRFCTMALNNDYFRYLFKK